MYYKLAETDPRFLAMDDWRMSEDLRAIGIYLKKQRGEPDEQEFDSDQTEDELLAELDALDNGGETDDDEETTQITSIADLLAEVDALGDDDHGG